MPQNQGPVVIQNQRPMGVGQAIFNAAVPGLVGGVANAAGGFLGSLIHEDPREALIKTQTATADAALNDSLMEGAQKYYQARNETPTSASLEAYYRAMSPGISDDRLQQLIAASTPTALTSDIAAQKSYHDQLRNDMSETPFAAAQGGAFAGAPAMTPAVVPGGEVAPVEVVMPAGAGAAVSSTSAAVEQAAKTEEAVSPVVGASTTAPPPVPAEVLPKSPTPQPLTPEAKAHAMSRLAQIQGMISFFGQTAAAAQKGEINPAQRNIAMAAIQSSDADIADLANLGRMAAGQDPSSRGVNYADLAYKQAAYARTQNQAYLDSAPPAQVAADKELGKQWIAAATSGTLKSYDFDMVNNIRQKISPEAMGGAYMQYVQGRRQQDMTRDIAKADRDLQKDNMVHQWGFKEQELDMAHQQLVAGLGMTAEQTQALHLSNADAATMVGARAEQFKVALAEARQSIKNANDEHGLKMSAGELNILVAQQAWANSSIDRATQIAGLEVSNDQRRGMQLQATIDRNNKIIADYDAKWNSNNASYAAQALIQKYADKPNVLKDEYVKMAGPDKAKVDQLAQALASSSNPPLDAPSTLQLAQAMAAHQQPQYGTYLMTRQSLEHSNYVASVQQATMASQDGSIADRIADINKKLTGAEAPQAVQQHQEVMNQYLSNTVVNQMTNLATRGVKGRSDLDAANYIETNSNLIPYLLGQATVSGGKVNDKYPASVFSPHQVSQLLLLARSARTPQGGALTADAFEKMVIDPRTGMTFGKALGKNLPAAYNVYATFAQGGF